MKKALSAIALLFAGLFLLSSCVVTPFPTPTPTLTPEEEQFFQEKNAALSELTPYSLQEYKNNCEDFKVESTQTSGSQPFENKIGDFERRFPIRRAVRGSNERMYLVYRFTLEGKDVADSYGIVELGKSAEDPWENWVRTGDTYFINSFQSRSDYADIVPGVSARELIAKDPGVVYDCYYRRPITIGQNSYQTVRLLSDGILYVTLSGGTDGWQNIESYTVEKVDFYSYGSEDLPMTYYDSGGNGKGMIEVFMMRREADISDASFLRTLFS